MSTLPDRRLTRYYSFAKFVDLLANGLFCAKATLFEDSWEGHVFHSVSAQPANREALAAFVDRAKEWIYVSCWNSSASESYAMWKLYGQNPEAVAVHTTSNRLKALMAQCTPNGPRGPMSVLSVVSYVEPVDGSFPELDPNTAYLASWGTLTNEDRHKWRNLMATCLAQKPTAYAYEQEMRLMLLDGSAPGFWEIADVPPQTPAGFRITQNDFAAVIDRISVAPDAPPWFIDVVRETMSRFGIDPSRVPVSRSTLFDGPTKRRA